MHYKSYPTVLPDSFLDRVFKNDTSVFTNFKGSKVMFVNFGRAGKFGTNPIQNP